MAFRGSQCGGHEEEGKPKVSNKMKFMQMLDSQTYRVLQKEAKNRGASIQELLRTVIIPDWLTEHRKRERP
jgi:hypothetical protein